MTDSALVISDLPAAVGLTNTALLEVQVGTGVGSSKKATIAEVLALAPAPAGGGITWSTVSVNTTMVNDNAYIAIGALDMTLPLTVATGKQFIVHAQSATVRVVSNGNVITGVGSGNNLTLLIGETAHLVARSTGNLEIV